MQPKLIWANLISENLERTKAFYSALSFKVDESHSDELISLSYGANNFVINFFVRSKLEKDFLGTAADANRHNEIIFSLSAESKEEVDQWHDQVIRAGGTIISKPSPYDQGYTFVYADPDGHRFNVLYWPGM